MNSSCETSCSLTTAERMNSMTTAITKFSYAQTAQSQFNSFPQKHTFTELCVCLILPHLLFIMSMHQNFIYGA